jgi:hypothetical protein
LHFAVNFKQEITLSDKNYKVMLLTFPKTKGVCRQLEEFGAVCSILKEKITTFSPKSKEGETD